MMAELAENELKCKECQEPVNEHHHNCVNCGAAINTEIVTVSIFNNADLRNVFILYFLYLFICLLIKYTNLFDSYNRLFWVELVLAAITLRFVNQNWAAMKPVLRFNNFSWRVLLGIVLIAVFASFTVSFAVQHLNSTFFKSEVSYFRSYRFYYFPVLIMIYSIAIMPALFEELTFRGVMFNYCANFLDDRLVIIVTAFLFAAMHLSLLSLIWLLPFGFFMGHLRHKFNTLWYGIIFHFSFNLTACIFDLITHGQLF